MDAARRPPPSATRPCASSVTTTAPRPNSRRSASPTPPAARAGRHGHRPAGLQRDLGQDDGRSHLRAPTWSRCSPWTTSRRRRPGARPPVRGGLRLPRRRDRGRARRPALHPAPRRHRVLRASGRVHGFYNNGTERVRWIETQAPQPPVRHCVPLGPAAGSATTTTNAHRGRKPMAERSGRHRRRHSGDRTGDRPPLRRAGRTVVLTGHDPGKRPAAVANGRRRRPAATFDLSEPHIIAARARRRRPVHASCSRDRPDAQHGRRLRHRHGDPARDPQAVGYTEVVHTLLDRLTRTPRSCCSAGWPRSGPIPGPPPSRRSTAASSG